MTSQLRTDEIFKRGDNLTREGLNKMVADKNTRKTQLKRLYFKKKFDEMKLWLDFLKWVNKHEGVMTNGVSYKEVSLEALRHDGGLTILVLAKCLEKSPWEMAELAEHLKKCNEAQKETEIYEKAYKQKEDKKIVNLPQSENLFE